MGMLCSLSVWWHTALIGVFLRIVVDVAFFVDQVFITRYLRAEAYLFSPCRWFISFCKVNFLFCVFLPCFALYCDRTAPAVSAEWSSKFAGYVLPSSTPLAVRVLVGLQKHALCTSNKNLTAVLVPKSQQCLQSRCRLSVKRLSRFRQVATFFGESGHPPRRSRGIHWWSRKSWEENKQSGNKTVRGICLVGEISIFPEIEYAIQFYLISGIYSWGLHGPS